MELGAFSVSLAVKDLAKSRAFYEALGFRAAHGDGEHFLILRSGAATIGLFQGMFEGNILTFNPGWTADGEEVDPFTDIRDIQARLKDAGLELTTQTDPEGTGPGHVALVDPDGNSILIDQHRS
ncbi:VOC family protein [Pseudoroseicyclus sp. H15]